MLPRDSHPPPEEAGRLAPKGLGLAPGLGNQTPPLLWGEPLEEYLGDIKTTVLNSKKFLYM